MKEELQNKRRVMLMVPSLHQGGLERICAFTAKKLSESCELSLVVFNTKDMFYDVGDAELFDLNLGSRPTKPGKILNLFKRIAAVKKIKKQKNIEVTYSFGATANLVNVFSKVRDKIWVGIRGYEIMQNTRRIRLFCKRADMVICCTKVMRDDVATYHPKAVEYLYNPCETGRNRKLSTEPVAEGHQEFFKGDGPIIASMSRVDDIKGFWHLIKAFSLIKKDIPMAKLMIIGGGDFSEYEKLAEALQIRQDVLFAGLQKNPFAYLAKATLYAMCSYMEGLPNSLIEAMSVGLTAVAVNCKSGPAEILSEDYTKAADQSIVHECDYGILLPLMNPVKNLDPSIIEDEERIFAGETVKLLRDPEKLAILQEKAKTRSDRFSESAYLEWLTQKMGLPEV